ncbi:MULTISPECIES: formate dehydrogenase subunit delta [unclassified Shinella]|uniref:formate dehydrogenase subunit delta n=1 Tax=unclassified Shinella TaxID=2643062 RepID=UPI00225D2937|nr:MULTISPECIES: formate dehydrogenase subunit delta [unclassified Shinella]MCO5139909.1 formate dehydrogenase subunit delta [Shinella sp.]MDC7257076.1 formate dehydrogenase subunit delta [Shinella sp. YE25]CAI0339940.1 NAD-dependent formate dehydrogenase delta subunit [Rhizobiaceae bacterium]CAK7258331.1 formate dehydrogenase subunit delta [Shinella sp. WSC3-e]
MSEGNKLVRMANQIATFFHSQPASEAANGVATHINKFWEPRMRRQFFDIVDNHGGEGLDSLVLQAAPLIHRPPPAEVPPAARAGNAPAP